MQDKRLLAPKQAGLVAKTGMGLVAVEALPNLQAWVFAYKLTCLCNQPWVATV